MSKPRIPSLLLAAFLLFTWGSCPCLLVDSAAALADAAGAGTAAEPAPQKTCACCRHKVAPAAPTERAPAHPQDCPCPTCKVHGPNHGLLSLGDGPELPQAPSALGAEHPLAAAVSLPGRVLHAIDAASGPPPEGLRPNVLLL